jgi:phospholipid/cholesterol/gamma-HCH transport system permease protein
MSISEAIAQLGAEALGLVRDARDLAWVFARTVDRTIRGRREPGDVVSQMFQIGNRSLLFIAVTLGFLGMVLVFQTCLQLNRVTGDLSPVGPEFIKALTHEFGPTITAMMLSTRVGAGIAAEIGSMVVTEQVDALRMCGVDPIDYLIVPRVLASVVMTVVLTTFGVLVATLLGMLTAKLSFRVNPVVFLDAGHVKFGDFFIGLAKCACYGVAIPIVAGTYGLGAKGGSEGVGAATTRAVIGASFAVLVLDLLVSSTGYLFVQTSAR